MTTSPATIVPARIVDIVRGALVVGVLGFLLLVGSPPATSSTLSTDTAGPSAYLDQVAVALAQPGLYVDPAVDELSAAQEAQIDAAASAAPGPVRIAVLSADSLRETDASGYSSSFDPLAYEPEELTAGLYDRVGVDGTYAVLVDATSEYTGRSFTAYQYAEDGPFYDVEGAVDAAVDCCAPNYADMLTTFVDDAGDEKANGWAIAGWVIGIPALLIGLIAGGRSWHRRRAERRADEQVADALRPALNEEVVELSTTVGALPPYVGDPEGDVGVRTRRVLDLVEQARHRLDDPSGDQFDTPADVEAVTTRLSDARYELLAIAALRAEKPVPERTAPCFFDPRHGPSVEERSYTPSGGTERQVPVCVACRAELDAEQVPEIRTITVDGRTRAYYDLDRYSRPYVNGYWQRYRFADDAGERNRRPPVRLLSSSSGGSGGGGGGGGFSFWEGGGSSSGGSGFWGGSSGSSGGGRSYRPSSSRRSSGGGRSRSSSRRSGGSRKF